MARDFQIFRVVVTKVRYGYRFIRIHSFITITGGLLAKLCLMTQIN